MMKRYLPILIFLIGTFFFASQNVEAAGEQCTSAGGTCRLSCSSSEDSIGREDCPTISSGKFGPIPQVCCVPECPSGQFCAQTSGPFQCSEQRNGTFRPCSSDGGLGNCCVPIPTGAPGINCPSAEMQCSELDAAGGGKSPCVRTLTYTGRPYARCKCANVVPTGSVACGSSCGRIEDCATGCGYCWAGNGSPICKDRPFSPPNPPSKVKLPKVFCDGNTPPNPIDTPQEGNARIYTAIGCIPVENTNQFVEFLLAWGAGISGGIAMLLIIYAGFMIITSGGNPQRLQAGKELLTAAIMGLVLLLFGVFIMQFIGVKILNIPGLSQ